MHQWMDACLQYGSTPVLAEYSLSKAGYRLRGRAKITVMGAFFHFMRRPCMYNAPRVASNIPRNISYLCPLRYKFESGLIAPKTPKIAQRKERYYTTIYS